ncbi:hypothetical protein [Flavobacterium litorale]|uniref:Lipoprotein n=1 Tax=Flavobacterium litorale TaxID=2856519 RepID=A0ABX8V8R6_9FLAO|nr:hypothetical protein [Flavobacterium litorale]QYJ69232.1 hypothetical protein K1I41_04900 [Flavobacterium litorale]
MKKFILLPMVALLFGCNATKSLNEASGKGYTATTCPEVGQCSFEVLKNKSLVIKKDGTGKVYYSMKENSTTTVIKYRYAKDTDPTLQDAGYTEEVVFEIASDATDLDYDSTTIQETKMLFGVMCFCKGKAGFYKVEKGTLTYKNNTLYITLPNIVEDQVLHDIQVTIQ